MWKCSVTRKQRSFTVSFFDPIFPANFVDHVFFSPECRGEKSVTQRAEIAKLIHHYKQQRTHYKCPVLGNTN